MKKYTYIFLLFAFSVGLTLSVTSCSYTHTKGSTASIEKHDSFDFSKLAYIPENPLVFETPAFERSIPGKIGTVINKPVKQLKGIMCCALHIRLCCIKQC